MKITVDHSVRARFDSAFMVVELGRWTHEKCAIAWDIESEDRMGGRCGGPPGGISAGVRQQSQEAHVGAGTRIRISIPSRIHNSICFDKQAMAARGVT